MKFGRDYHKHQLAEWSDAYVNYADLKRLCKASSAAANEQGKERPIQHPFPHVERLTKAVLPLELIRYHSSQYLSVASMNSKELISFIPTSTSSCS